MNKKNRQHPAFHSVHRRLLAGVSLLACVLMGSAALASEVWVGQFSAGPSAWREIQLKADLKRNTFKVREWDGVMAMEVMSSSSISLLARPVTVDLVATPILCWRWRVDAPLVKADMTQRSGDDYAARLYVSLRIPDTEKSLALRTKLSLARAIWGADVPDAAINYVWDNRHPVGLEMPNAYTDRTMMVVQQTGATNAGRWVWERRNLAADAARLFGKSAVPVQLAITADTDNTGESARAGFADIYFTNVDNRCTAQPVVPLVPQ